MYAINEKLTLAESLEECAKTMMKAAFPGEMGLIFGGPTSAR